MTTAGKTCKDLERELLKIAQALNRRQLEILVGVARALQK